MCIMCIGIAMAKKWKMEEMENVSMKRQQVKGMEVEFLYLNYVNIFVSNKYLLYYNFNLHFLKYLCLLSSFTTISLKTK